ncbi:MAG: deoxyribodipyrimidine photo-lyase [Acidimicrobiales bacterium]|nr:deoxyribodipyrimidine photo-lyase [Acidimicrobiales bacterium]
MTDRTIMWFRRDLRLSDNPALVAAHARGRPVVPLFVVDPALWGPAGANRRAFLAGCLRALDDDSGGTLVVRHGDPAEVLPALAREVDASAVYAAADFGPYGRRRDDAVAEALAADDRELVLEGSPYAVEPGTVLNKEGEPYKVFTPFLKAWRQVGWPAPVRRPVGLGWVSGVESDALPEVEPTADELPDPGEQAARRRLDSFLRTHVERYADRRNDPGVDGTSRLSPYLKWGCLHPRQILNRLGDTEGAATFRTELAWREFYADVLFHRPDTARAAFREAMAAMAVDEGPDTDEAFTAWCEGRTGYPIVDAGMRQLLTEGWMHNRVRMIAASFLVKDLHLDWTRGARHFMAHLVDGDLASNQHGWQWVAGTGTDAAPYFRVFNPVTQSRRFDPDGTYLRRWLPELADLDDVAIHEPWTADPTLFAEGTGSGYPPPIVDHATERAEALARYAELG